MRAPACLLLTLLLAAACKAKPASIEAPLPDVAFAGCVEVVDGVCRLNRNREIKVWIEGNAPALVFKAGETSIAGNPTRVRGGQFIRFKVPAASKFVTAFSDGRVVRVIALGDRVKDDALSKAADLAQSDMAGARMLLQKCLSTADKERGARVHSLLGRIDMQEGRYDEALTHLAAASQGFAQIGHSLLQGQDLLTMSFVAGTRKGDPKRAARYLDDASAILHQAPQLRAEFAYQRGLLESMSGNVRGALVAFEQAVLWAQRLADEEVTAAAQQWMAMTMSSLGRLPEALELQMQIVNAAKEAIPCIRIPLLATAAWLSVQQQPLDEALARARLAAARSSLNQCPDRFRARNILVNEAELAVATDNMSEARRLLQELKQNQDGQTASLAVQELELEGRLLLSEHTAKPALQLLQRAETIAQASGLDDEVLRLTVLRARALATMGHVREAVALLEDSEQRLDQRLQVVPVGEARVRFLKVRDEGVRLLVTLHMGRGETKQAFQAARRGRSRALRAVALGEALANLPKEAKDKWLADLAAYQRLRVEEEETSPAWSLSQDELQGQADLKEQRAQRAQEALDMAYANLAQSLPQTAASVPTMDVQPGEVVLLYFREHAQSSDLPWRGYAVTKAGIKTERLPSVRTDVPQSDHPWLRPFATLFSGANRIRVLATDPVTEEMHAASFNKEPLYVHFPVVYGLDVSSPPEAGGAPLVVADPLGDLPSASVEGRDVMSLLKTDRGFFGRQATRQAVIAALGSTGWFHYAGHSLFEGADGLESGLPLAGQQHLLAADVLSLPAVPRVVVLSSCEAGRSSGDSNTAGLGLAQAFVVAGAKVVIAPTRPVADEVSRAFMQQFYKHVSAGLPPERALQTVVSEANAQQQSDWATFRVLVP